MEKEIFSELCQNYSGISDMLKMYDVQEITERAAEFCGVSTDYLNQYPMGGYSKGHLSGEYRYVLQDLKKNICHYDWVYDKLADDTSKLVFTKLIQYRLIPDMQLIAQAYDGEHHQYFDKTIISCDEHEVFVDCGGYIGDTTLDYIEQYGEYKTIYIYEPAPSNIIDCRKNLQNYKHIEIRCCGVGEKNSVLPMTGADASGSFVTGAANGEQEEFIQVISLDEDIQEKVTYIKMDVEGFEIPAIIGAKNHIMNDRPKLAICVYHCISDIWEIPKLIDSIAPDYDYHIRHYMENQNWETVIYAVPKKQEQNQSKQTGQRRVAAMAPYERGWFNVELIKDCGLIPYLLYKNHNCSVSMVGAKGEEYPYLEKYVNGLEMEFLENGSITTKLEYIKEHAKQIDCLILRGCYSSNFSVALFYKKLNPAGRIYVGLDANSNWMDRIPWYKPEFIQFMDSCDIIATSCRAMQKYLNEKWPWNIRLIPNGYYNITQNHEPPKFEEKDNLILTVGRLGTSQKATNILLEAFAAASELIPDWTLQLVGNIETSFQGYLEDYFMRYPYMKDKILISGSVSNQDILSNLYKKAKIFALSSTLEGGTPNVISQALHAGCVIATTKIDAYEDATDFGRCGMAAEIDSVSGFADILIKLCTNPNLKQLSENACNHGNQFYDMQKITARLNYMIFGEDKIIEPNNL